MSNFYDAWQGIVDNTFPLCQFNEYSANKSNLYGYRSDEFNGFEEGKKYLITLGDSWCYCAGIPDFSKTWNFLLKEKLNCDYIYNLGISGASIDYCARILFLLLNKYKPKGKIYLVCMFPSTLRTEFFENTGKYISNITSKDFLGSKNPIHTVTNLFIYRNFFKNEYNNLDRFLRNYNLIDLLCKLHNIELVWTDWRQNKQLLPDKHLQEFYKNFCLKNKNYLDMTSYFAENNIDFIPVSEIDLHPGVEMQPKVAQLIFDFFTNSVKITPYSALARQNTDYEYSQEFENHHIKTTT